jgi:hypothetical protein
VGSPGSAAAPLGEPLGEGEASAKVDSAVRMKKAGTPNASTTLLVTRIEANHIEPNSRRA